jgi:hypothetical protein
MSSPYFNCLENNALKIFLQITMLEIFLIFISFVRMHNF